jgi:hypothetical protein
MRPRFALVIVTGLALVALMSGRVAHAEPATVIDDFGCLILAADSGLAVNLVTQESHAVQAANGNVNFTCHFVIPDGQEPASTMHHSGFLCGTQFGFTTDTWSVTTKGGRVLLRCQVKA